MQKRTYYIPTIEIISLQSAEMMALPSQSKGDYAGGGDAPERREKAF